MKKTIIILMLPFTCFAQKEAYVYFSGAIDIKNAIVGSNPTKNNPELDLLYQFGMVGNNIEVNIGYENFKAIDFDKYSIGIGYHFPLYGIFFKKQIKTILISSIEPCLINRWGNWSGGIGDRTQISGHLSIGVNASLRWKLTEKIYLEYLYSILPRTDLNAMYGGNNFVYSNYLKLLYKVK
jgi:hypothetical protein